MTNENYEMEVRAALSPNLESRVVTVRCKAFSTEGVRENSVMVDRDGRVRVWDSIGKIYTVCHCLAPRAERRIRKIAGF